MNPRTLLVGSGTNHTKKLSLDGNMEWGHLTTLDINPDVSPSVVHDLGDLPLPFADDTFTEVHAYDTLEHVGAQGDWRFFFAQWSDFWRILRPGGVFYGICPAPHSVWVWADPGHTRAIHPDTLTFLDQTNYAQIATGSPMTDYRPWYTADFQREASQISGDSYCFALRAIKPARKALHHAR